MSLKSQLDLAQLPKHIAIIMDGNGRWAKQQGAERIFGHNNGVKSVREAAEGCAELGIKYLTLYAFSTENWNRPPEEVNALMELLVQTIRGEMKTLTENNIRLQTIGNTDGLPEKCKAELLDAIEKTSKHSGMNLVLALNYSARWEIANAAKKIASLSSEKKISASEVNENFFAEFLNTQNIPDPELLIRTSGELRISNFLLWQIAYTELYFTETLWPDFTREELYRAIADYQRRERRFGKISEQVRTA